MAFMGRPGRLELRAPIVCVAITGMLSVVLLGCGVSGDGLNRQAVSGTITMEGSPLAAGTIQFLPDGGDPAKAIGGGAPITGGAYEIAADSGLPPGKYIVTISAPAGGADAGGGPGSGAALPKETIPEKYNTASTLKAEVKAGASNTFDFQLTP